MGILLAKASPLSLTQNKAKIALLSKAAHSSNLLHVNFSIPSTTPQRALFQVPEHFIPRVLSINVPFKTGQESI